jgi:PAS domain S-box-containing protein
MPGDRPSSDESRGSLEPVSLEQRQMADSLPQLVWMCQPDGACVLLSRRWVEYTGVPEEEQLGFGWLSQLHPGDRDRTAAAWRESVITARAFDLELRIRRLDGVHRWFRSVALPVCDDAGRVVKWFGSSTDIDDEKRAANERERLLASAQRHAAEVEAILSTHADGLVIYGADGEIRSMNPASRRLFGVPEGEPIPEYGELMKRLRPLDVRGTPVDLTQFPSRRAARGEHVERAVTVVQTPGGPVSLSTSAAPLKGPDGATVGAVVSFVDITHVRRLQEEREQTIRTLTHEARTRLNVIQTHGEMLGRAEVTEAIAQHRAALIVSNAHRLAEMIDTLVDGR